MNIFPDYSIKLLTNAVASNILVLSAHTPRLQVSVHKVSVHKVSVHTVSACWRSELGYDTPSRYLASAGIP